MIVRLPRLFENWQDDPVLVRRYWDQAMNQIEDILNDLLAIPEIEAALEDLDTAVETVEAAATAAQTSADEAQEAVDSVAVKDSLKNSYVDNFTAPLLSISSTGSLEIKTHDRVYGDATLNPTVTVNGETIATGAVSGDVVRVSYEDSSRAGGTVIYDIIINGPAPVQSGDTHVVGAATVPATGTTDGNIVRPPGYVEP